MISVRKKVSPKRRFQRKLNRLAQEDSEGCDPENSERKSLKREDFEQLNLVVPPKGLYTGKPAPDSINHILSLTAGQSREKPNFPAT
ncbi:unnamed protein product, partial [Allacma fusca]